MKRAILFLNSSTSRINTKFYKKLVNGKFIVAVDGGFDFLKKMKIEPDIIIGDLDSITKNKFRYLDVDKVFHFPEEKDESDLELALEFCLEERFSKIDIVQPEIGETDHFLANLFLLSKFHAKQKNMISNPSIRIIDEKSEFYFLSNNEIILNGQKNDIVSIIPISGSIVLNLTGTVYPAKKLKVKRGETISLRNRFSTKRVSISVEGDAFVYHRFKSSQNHT